MQLMVMGCGLVTVGRGQGRSVARVHLVHLWLAVEPDGERERGAPLFQLLPVIGDRSADGGGRADPSGALGCGCRDSGLDRGPVLARGSATVMVHDPRDG